jgi:murein DD-endopeptidase MepM/ murein hydrolase activator NlpD
MTTRIGHVSGDNPRAAHLSSPLVQQVNGVYSPVQGLNPNDVLQGGYAYLQWSDAGGCWHEAADLNAGNGGDADLGLPVVAMLDGVVEHVEYWDGWSDGFGRQVWMFVDDERAAFPVHVHYAHLDQLGCQEGQRVPAGTLVGTLGKSGNQPWAHCHTALWLVAPPELGLPWDFWQVPPEVYTYAWVDEHTWSPGDWFWQSAEKAGGMGPAEELPMSVSPEELEAYRPYFEQLGIVVNPEAAIYKRACLAYKRDETPGPAMSDEYPYGDYTRQDYTARTGEWHPDDGQVYWVELNKERR